MKRDRTASITPTDIGPYHQGVPMTFDITCEDPKPMVSVVGIADGVTVYNEYHRMWEPGEDGEPQRISPAFGLESEAYQEGEADCIASLYRSDYKGGFITLATVSFHVEG